MSCAVGPGCVMCAFERVAVPRLTLADAADPALAAYIAGLIRRGRLRRSA